METKKRLNHTFQTAAAAEVFADALRKIGQAEDVTVIPKVNAEDKARGYAKPRDEGAKVCWTEWGTD